MVLITRPLEQSIELAELLKQNSINSAIFPTLEIKELSPENNNQYDVVIFISKNAAIFGAKFLATQNNYLLFAVGETTANALNNLGYKVDDYPKNNPSSRELLKLDLVKNLRDKNILIVRGVGGVETLKNELSLNNKVDYLEVYQRIKNPSISNYIGNFRDFMGSNNQIIIITSIDIFEALITLTKDIYLLNLETKFVVASMRIKKYLQNRGFFNIIVAGVKNNQILDGVKQWLN